jgi:hypothetical protein
MTAPAVPEEDDGSPKDDQFFDAEGEEEDGADNQQEIYNNVRDIVDMLGGPTEEAKAVDGESAEKSDLFQSHMADAPEESKTKKSFEMKLFTEDDDDEVFIVHEEDDQDNLFVDANPFKDKLSSSETLPTINKVEVVVNDNYMAELEKSTHDQNIARRRKNKKDRNLSIHQFDENT